MNILLLCLLFTYMSSVKSEDKNNPDTSNVESVTEDQRVINETLTKYGHVEDFTKLGLPGPEIRTDKKIFSLNNQFVGDSKNYTLRIRTIIQNLSYNARFEHGTIKIVHNQEEPNVTGLFTEHFVRHSGGYYIRSIGYTLDENGYRQFLIDLSTATITSRRRISSTALASLVGGNALG